MSPLSSIFTDQNLSPFNPMNLFFYTRRCFHQFETNQYDGNDLYGLTEHYLLKKPQPLAFSKEQQEFETKHREAIKGLSEKLLTIKVAEQHFLGELASIINFAAHKNPNEKLDEARKIVQLLRYNNETIINQIYIRDASYCAFHKKKSKVNDIVSDYKTRNTPPLFLHPKHPEDALKILQETMGTLVFSAQKTCDVKCHMQLEKMAYFTVLAEHGLITDHGLSNIKSDIKNDLTDIYNDRYSWTQIDRKLSNIVFDALYDIVDDFLMSPRP